MLWVYKVIILEVVGSMIICVVGIVFFKGRVRGLDLRWVLINWWINGGKV